MRAMLDAHPDVRCDDDDNDDDANDDDDDNDNDVDDGDGQVWGGDPGGAAAAADEVALEEVAEGEHETGGGRPHGRRPRLRHLLLHPRGGGQARGARPQTVQQGEPWSRWRCRGSSYLCYQDPFTLKSGKYLRELFPNSKFLFMVRDGRATVHSIISRKVTITGWCKEIYKGESEAN